MLLNHTEKPVEKPQAEEAAEKTEIQTPKKEEKTEEKTVETEQIQRWNKMRKQWNLKSLTKAHVEVTVKIKTPKEERKEAGLRWWTEPDLNRRSFDYQSNALAVLSYRSTFRVTQV